MSYSCSDFYSDVMDAARRIASEAGLLFPEAESSEALDDDANAVIFLLQRLSAGRDTAAADPAGKAAAACSHLRAARDLLKAAGATKSVYRVRHALKSAEGAVRAAGYRSNREKAAP